MEPQIEARQSKVTARWTFFISAFDDRKYWSGFGPGSRALVPGFTPSRFMDVSDRLFKSAKSASAGTPVYKYSNVCSLRVFFKKFHQSYKLVYATYIRFFLVFASSTYPI